MRSQKSYGLKASIISTVMALTMLFAPGGAELSAASASAPEGSSCTVTYKFSGDGKNKAGYAEGSIKLSVTADGSYKLYWANDTRALDGYEPLGEYKSLKAGDSRIVKMGYHTAIPKDATKIIATKGSLKVSDACAVYTIPDSKRLSAVSGELLYTYSAFSDLHIDVRDSEHIFWVNSKRNLRNALDMSARNGSEFIVVSGDCVNNSLLDAEWDAYEKIISQSAFVNPVWETDGNHDLKVDVSSGLSKFIKATGTDGSQNSKSYFSMTEENTGDLFIFMSLELSDDPKEKEVFSDKQIAWAKDLIAKNYSQRNIFLVQHAPVNGFGAGDRMSNPYYPFLMDPSHGNNGKFKKLLQDYPDIVFISGHTHEDFSMGYNYSDENDTAANMIHVPSLAATTEADSTGTKLDYKGNKESSQGYFVQVFENEIVFNGIDVIKEKILPSYSYIMEGGRTSASAVNAAAVPRELKGVTVSIEDILCDVSGILYKYYKYASYDSYQALKKYYYQYKDQTFADESVIDEFNDRIAALSVNTGGITVPTLYDKYYFVNNYGWSSVYAYAWDNFSNNAEWPGVKLTKCGINSQNQDIYMVTWDKKGKYKYLIFSNGSNSKQTADISLTDYKYNGFYISGTDNGKYKVANFSMDTDIEERQFYLLYYVKGEHDWDKRDLRLRMDSDGIYRGVYHPSGNKAFSCSVYDGAANKYYSLSESSAHTFAGNNSFTDTLTRMSSRGKSVTVSGLSSDYLLVFEFDPSARTLTTCCQYYVSEPLENTSSISAENVKYGGSVTLNASAAGGAVGHTYSFMYKKADEEDWTTLQDFGVNASLSFKPTAKGEYVLCISVKDSSGTVVSRSFPLTVFASIKNTSTVPAKAAFKDSVTVKASASGGLGSYQFAVYYKQEESTGWVQAQKYSASTTVTFKPSKAAVYDVCVKVKDSRGVIVKKYMKVSVTKPVNTSRLSAPAISLGKSFVIKCSARDGAGGYQYQVYYKRSTSDSWNIRQRYSENTRVTLKPTAAISYDFCVSVKDANGNIDKIFFSGTVTNFD